MSALLNEYYNDKDNKKKRSLSSRIVSRWYRSPEVILTEKEYESTLDIWSMGCILAETLTCSQLYIDNKIKELGYQE
jgi:serine/threonine protein kinase